MIPKIIHYCWFGDNPMPEIVQKCIESWKRVMPDYEIRKWDESNVPYMHYDFMREAYKARKFAFVSDQARFWVLQQYGGFFLDTDVETLKPFDDLCDNQCFFAFGKHVKKDVLFVSPGLIMGAEAGNQTIKGIFQLYSSLHFLKDGVPQLQHSSPRTITKYLLEYEGLEIKDECQMLQNGIKVYATDYFDPINPRTLTIGSKIDLTPNTYAIHHGTASWVPRSKKIARVVSILLRRIFGDTLIDKVRGKENF